MDVLSKDSITNASTRGPFSTALLNLSPQIPSLGASLCADQTIDQWSDAFVSKSIALFFMNAGFFDLLSAKSRPGETSSIINISSSLAHTNLSIGVSAYEASKVPLRAHQITRD
ncbi:hypothetical protein Hypma_010963 [Hypsizygus marmoreus]|uniref:Uncharacterized protein n=1 Tax=Hypsizygus marmoreus TaxID=39966 RepID=A0A369JQE7_HYPMA|nr:hypothetical protein Hypma_010963 [Hypsizygus marmoreus]